jgi:hypothetical protein
MVTVLERDNQLLRSTLANKEETGVKAAGEQNTENPLRMSIIRNSRPSVVADVIFVPQSENDNDPRSGLEASVPIHVSTNLPFGKDFSQECLFTMRGFVPPHIFSASLASLVGTDGLSEPLAKRLLSKKCLWLVRMDPQDIQKLSEDAFKSR